jgi:thiol-disulfide isomerase/thioredoxin
MKPACIVLTLLLSTCLNAQVNISGTVKNYTDSVFYIIETGGFHNFTRVWRDNRVAVKIDGDHHFKAVVPEKNINTWYIKTSAGIQPFDLIAGQNLTLVADFSQAIPLTATGDHADDFNYTAYLNSRISTYKTENKFNEKIKAQNIDSLLTSRYLFAHFKMETLDAYKPGRKVSDKYYAWLISKYSYEPFERTLVENIKNRDSLDENTISKIMTNGINDEYAALNTPEYNDLIDFYVRTVFNRTKNPNATLAERLAFIADGDLLSGSTKDVYLSRFIAWMIKTPDSVYAPLFKKYDEVVHNKEMKTDVINRRNDYTNTAAAPSEEIDEQRARSISEILKKYRGKVVYIDFWASWCIPCRAEMPNAAALKQKLKGKDIVFLYLGYNDKTPAWEKARIQLEIEGEHYLLDEKMVKEAEEMFGINGIPHYAVIDKKGKILSRRAARPSDVYTDLIEALKK